MKKSLMSLIVAILVFSTIYGVSALDKISSDKGGLPPGIVFKAPEATDSNMHASVKELNSVVGTEIYLNWADVEKQEGVYDWSVFDKRIAEYKKQGKKVTVSVVSTSFGINDTPSYLFTKYNVRRVSKGFWLNFENGDRNYDISGTNVTDPNLVIAGANSLKGSSVNSENIILKTNDIQIMNSSHGYSIQFDYKLLKDSTFFVRVTPHNGNLSESKYFEWSGKAGEKGSKTAEVDNGDYITSFGIKNGEYIIDNVNIIERKPGFFVGNLTFPNYFDPIFKEKFGNFVKAYAKKYNNNPDVGLVYISGFGRWDEITLCNDSDLKAFEDQWVSYGYTDQKYIDHIKWCIDTYQKNFTNKELMMSCAGYPGADAFRDQWLIDFKLSNYIASKGIAIKYNGWQAKGTEWNTKSNAIYYTFLKNKNNPKVRTIFEQGAQVNGAMSEIMGNPISMLNMPLIYNIDNLWFYNNDILDQYSSRYFQYFNEQAGSSLITKLYNISNLNKYVSLLNMGAYKHYDIFLSAYGQNSDKLDHSDENGVQITSTNSRIRQIIYSIDDRLKYAGMYGSTLSVDYLDKGTDTFKIYANIPETNENKQLVEVKKTNSGKFKTISIYNTEWTNSYKSGTDDSFKEIIIDDNRDGIESVKGIEINYVSGIDWEQKLVDSKNSDGKKTAISIKQETPTVIEIPVKNNQLISSIELPIGTSDTYSYVNIMATVEAKVNGKYVLLTRKEMFMPNNDDIFTIPLASKPNVEALKISLVATQGTAFLKNAGNNLSYKLYSFNSNKNESTKVNNGIFAALKPMYALQLNKSDIKNGEVVTLTKFLPDGSKNEIAKTKAIEVNGKMVIAFEPQTSGRYEIILPNNKKISNLKPFYLNRVQKANQPMRDLTGEVVKSFNNKDKQMWKAISGLDNIKSEKKIFTAELTAENPTIETNKAIEVKSDRTDTFHFILKNETSSNMAKLYFKTKDNDFNNSNFIYIPVVANDTEFREYNFLVGYDKIWYGRDITGLRFQPVTGHTDTGKISILLAELRTGTNKISKYNEKLDVTKLTSGANISFKSNGDNTAENDSWFLPVLLILIAVCVVVISFVLIVFIKMKSKK